MSQSAVDAARKAGYSDAEIAGFLAEQKGFDIEAARKAGYADSAIVAEMTKEPGKPMIPHGAVKNPGGGYAMPSLVEDQGILSSMASGAGRTIDKWIAGAMQTLGIGDQDRLKQEQAAKDAGYRSATAAHPFAAGVGEGIPAAAVTAPLVGPLSGVLGSGLFGIAGTGAVLGAAPEALKYGTLGERGINSAIGAGAGAAGGLIGAGISKLVSPAARVTTKPYPMRKPGAMDDAIAAADRIGYTPTAGDVTGSPMLRAYENKLLQQPGFSGQMLEHIQRNQVAVNRAAAKAIGQNADEISETTFATADQAISDAFKKVLNGRTVNVQTDDFLAALDDIARENAPRGPYAIGKIEKEVNKALELWGEGKIPAESYGSIRSRLGTMAGKAFKAKDTEVGNALLRIQSALDDAAELSLPEADRALLATARQQSGDLKALMRGQTIKAGNVSPAQVATSLRTFNPRTFRRGTSNSELMDIARIGEAFPSYGNPNSASQLGFGGGLSGWISAAKNKVGGEIYLSPAMQKYLMSNAVPDEVRRALAVSGVPVGAGAAGLLTSGQ